MIMDMITPIINKNIPLQNIKACLFDFDGVIVDSEKLHTDIKNKILDELGIIDTKNVVMKFQGRPDIDFFNYVFQELLPKKIGGTRENTVKSMLLLKYDLYDKYSDNVELIDGINEMLACSKKQFDHTVIVTSSIIKDVKKVTDKYFNSETFDYIVSCEDTERHKPFPDPYNRAVFLCGLRPEQCLVIEDSPTGVLAAKVAGCFVAGITNTFPQGALIEAKADIVFDRYEQLQYLLNTSRCS
jgi:beta-phosphoglucomutase|tara:strand:+ start:1279 stop:2004 length:726 start_codon:yes stop_codon:yes gene_type:complete